MSLNEYKKQVDETVVESMVSFMTEWDDCDYNMEDVESCKEILYTYLDNLYAMVNPNDDDIMKRVEIVVLKLNRLNEKTDYALIETEEREAIWEIRNCRFAGRNSGYKRILNIKFFPASDSHEFPTCPFPAV